MRYIPVLEFPPHTDTEVTPPSAWLEKTNGTLHAIACRLLTDAQGFMVSERRAAPDDRRVLMLGNSTSENLFVPLDQRILTRIEAYATGAGLPCKTYSAAISNAHLLHAINLLLNKGIALRPHAVICYPTFSLDLRADESDNTFWNADPALSTIRSAKLQPQPLPDLTRFPGRGGLRDMTALLGCLAAICARFDIRLLLATWPIYGAYDDFMSRYQTDRVAFDQEQARMQAANEAIRTVAAATDSALIDLEREFATLDHHVYFYDWNHPNIAGCDLIASLSADILQACF